MGPVKVKTLTRLKTILPLPRAAGAERLRRCVSPQGESAAAGAQNTVDALLSTVLGDRNVTWYSEGVDHG